MNTIALIGAIASVAGLAFVRRWPYQVIVIDFTVQTTSLAWAITTGQPFWIAVNGSLIGVLIVLLFLIGGPGKRRPAPKVIGDESRRLRDALVRTLRERESPSSS